MSSETFRKAFRICWIDNYLESTDIIFHDARNNFMRAALQTNSDMLHIRTKTLPVQSAISISIVEQYLSLILRAYYIINNEAPDLGKEATLQMAVKALNV